MLQHMKHTAALRENPEAIAKKAIKVLEQRLASRYGIYLQYGCELEWSIVPTSAAAFKDRSLNPLGSMLPHRPESDNKFAPTRQQKIQTHRWNIPHQRFRAEGNDPLFPNHGFVAYSYNEFSQKYETIISHLGTHSHLPIGWRGLTFAKAIENLRHQLHTHLGSPQKAPENSGYNEAFSALKNHWRIITPADYNGANYGDACTHGMHINISMHPTNPKAPPRNHKLFNGKETSALKKPLKTCSSRVAGYCQVPKNHYRVSLKEMSGNSFLIRVMSAKITLKSNTLLLIVIPITLCCLHWSLPTAPAS